MGVLHPVDRFNTTCFATVNQTFAIDGVRTMAAFILVGVARIPSNFLPGSHIVYLIREHNTILLLHPALLNHHRRCHVVQATLGGLVLLLVEMRPMAFPLVQHAVHRLFYVEASCILVFFFRGIVHRTVEGLSFPLILALIARNEIPRQLFDRVLNFSLVHHGTPVLMPISVLISAQLVDRVEHAGMLLAIGIH